MRRLRDLLTLTLAVPTLLVLFLLTLYVPGVIWRHGLRPTRAEGGTSDCNGVVGFRIVEPTVTADDWLGFIAFEVALIALQVGLAFLIRGAWRSLRIREET